MSSILEPLAMLWSVDVDVGCSFDIAAVAAVSMAARTLTHLTRLCLGHRGVQPASAIGLAAALSGLTGLCHLSLGDHPVGESGIL